jgi:hypothetical protein
MTIVKETQGEVEMLVLEGGSTMTKENLLITTLGLASVEVLVNLSGNEHTFLVLLNVIASNFFMIMQSD